MSQCCPEPLECPCPPVGLIDIVGRKWAVCVVSLLGRYGVVRFAAIQRCLSRVSPATLTTTLRSLERASLIRRAVVSDGDRDAFGYELTVRGVKLNESLKPFATWLRAA